MPNHSREPWVKVKFHLKPDPLGYPRHGLVVFLLCLVAVSGISVFTTTPAAGSMEEGLPSFVQLVWGAMLFAGGVAALLGMFWQGDVRTGLVAKRFGYVALAVAAVPYSVVILGTYGFGGLLSAGIILGFAGACAHTARRVEKRIQEILKKKQAEDLLLKQADDGDDDAEVSP